MPEAATALALLRMYAEYVSLADTSTWSISAMPSYSGPRSFQRFSTISSGSVELFFVAVDTHDGMVDHWGVRLDHAVPVPEGVETASVGEDVYVYGESVHDLDRLLADPGLGEAIRATRRRRQSPRRTSWHNPWLAALICPTENTASAGAQLTSAPDEEVMRRYYARITQQRGHQRAFRQVLLRTYGARCHHCGTDILAVLEAAHLEADSTGGAASAGNGRILCANHHRAFDAGLLTWNGHSFERAEGVPEIPPSAEGCRS